MFSKALKWSILGCILPTPASSSTPPSPLVLQLSNCTIAGTSVHSWGFRLDLADPSQYPCAVPSTVVNSTLVIGSDFCQTNSNLTTAQCESLCGGTFNTSAAGTSYTSSPASAILAPNPVWAEISPDALLAGTTGLQLPPSSSSIKNHLSDYPIGIITSGNHQNVGHLGLANDSDFLHSAFCNGVIPAIGFGLNSGSQSVANPRDGSLVLGGYDLGSVNQRFFNYSIVAASSSERKCPLQVIITRMVLRFPLAENFMDVTLSSLGVQVPACIEPYDNLFRFPQTVLQSFKDATGWSADTTADPSLYVVEPGLYYPQTKGFNGSLIIKLSNEFEVEIPNEELSNPLRDINTNGARVLTQRNITEVGIFSEDAPLNTATLGKVFLSKAYLAVDYGMNQFMLSHIVAGATNSDLVRFNSTSVTCPSPSPSTGRSGWTAKKTHILLESLLPSLFVISCCVTGLWFFFRSHAARRRENMAVNQSSSVVLSQTQSPGEQHQRTTTDQSPPAEEIDLTDRELLPRRSSSIDGLNPAHARNGHQDHHPGNALRQVSG